MTETIFLNIDNTDHKAQDAALATTLSRLFRHSMETEAQEHTDHVLFSPTVSPTQRMVL